MPPDEMFSDEVAGRAGQSRAFTWRQWCTGSQKLAGWAPQVQIQGMPAGAPWKQCESDTRALFENAGAAPAGLSPSPGGGGGGAMRPVGQCRGCQTLVMWIRNIHSCVWTVSQLPVQFISRWSGGQARPGQARALVWQRHGGLDASKSMSYLHHTH